MSARQLAAGQSSQLWVCDPSRETPLLVFETPHLLLEAPNWSLDGRSLYLNGDGRLWRLDADAPTAPAEVPFDDLPEINNDHVLAPDGESIFMSADDGHIYRGALTGGPVERVTADDGTWHFLHGISPGGDELAYVEIPRGSLEVPGELVVMPATGGPGRRVDTGPRHVDGPEYSPDGEWICFNTEGFTTTPGHAQLARTPARGGRVERLVDSESVDWFPHLSPDGRFFAYVAFPPGTLGHPPDVPVEVRVAATEDWAAVVRAYPLFGGQGTMNVNSWAPDSSRFAVVAHPLGGGPTP